MTAGGSKWERMGSREGEKGRERGRGCAHLRQCRGDARGGEKVSGTTVGLDCDCTPTQPANLVAGNSLGSPFFLLSFLAFFFPPPFSSVTPKTRGRGGPRRGGEGTDTDGRLTYCFARLEINLPGGKWLRISRMMYRDFFDNLELINLMLIT